MTDQAFIYDDDEAEDQVTFGDLSDVQQMEVLSLQSRYDDVLAIEDEDKRLVAAMELVEELNG